MKRSRLYRAARSYRRSATSAASGARNRPSAGRVQSNRKPPLQHLKQSQERRYRDQTERHETAHPLALKPSDRGHAAKRRQDFKQPGKYRPVKQPPLKQVVDHTGLQNGGDTG